MAQAGSKYSHLAALDCKDILQLFPMPPTDLPTPESSTRVSPSKSGHLRFRSLEDPVTASETGTAVEPAHVARSLSSEFSPQPDSHQAELLFDLVRATQGRLSQRDEHTLLQSLLDLPTATVTRLLADALFRGQPRSEETRKHTRSDFQDIKLSTHHLIFRRSSGRPLTIGKEYNLPLTITTRVAMRVDAPKRNFRGYSLTFHTPASSNPKKKIILDVSLLMKSSRPLREIISIKLQDVGKCFVLVEAKPARCAFGIDPQALSFVCVQPEKGNSGTPTDRVNPAELLRLLQSVHSHSVPPTALKNFYKKHFMMEVLLFWLDAERFHHMQTSGCSEGDMRISAKRIYDTYFNPESPQFVTLPPDITTSVASVVAAGGWHWSMYIDAQDEAFANLVQNPPPRAALDLHPAADAGRDTPILASPNASPMLTSTQPGGRTPPPLLLSECGDGTICLPPSKKLISYTEMTALLMNDNDSCFVPVVPFLLAEFIEQNDGLRLPNLFFSSTDEALCFRVKRNCGEFDAFIEFGRYDTGKFKCVHLCAALLKHWYRDLPTPVLNAIPDAHFLSLEVHSEDECVRISQALPHMQQHLLQWLLRVVSRAALMSGNSNMQAYAMVLAPNMFCTDQYDTVRALIINEKVVYFVQTLLQRELALLKSKQAGLGR